MIKKIITSLPVLVFMVMGLTVASCQNKTDSTSQATGRTGGGVVSVEKFDELMQADKNAYVIDVRTPGEYSEGFVKNAVNIDINSPAFEAEISKLDTGKTVYVYCLAGSRSASAAEYMRKKGFRTVYEMDGGTLKWKRAGKPLVTSNTDSQAGGMTPEEFTAKVTTDNYVLVDYHAKWCKPCIKMAPILDKVAADKKDKLVLLKVDADENEALIQHKGIDAIPVLELYHKGQLVWTHKGFIDEAGLLKATGL